MVNLLRIQIFHKSAQMVIMSRKNTTVRLNFFFSVSLQQQQEAVKKQHISPVETTHRRREEGSIDKFNSPLLLICLFVFFFFIQTLEIEWTPAGLDLDLNAFDNAVEEYHSHRSILDKDIFEEGFPVIERQFKKDFIPVEPVFEVENETDTPALNIEEEPTSVEYGPPKEEGTFFYMFVELFDN